MKIIDAFLEGFRNMSRTKRYIFLVYISNLLVALILGVSLGMTLHSSLGDSLAGENLLKGFDGLWYRNFASQAKGLANSFDPSVVGIGAVFNGLEAFIKGSFLNGQVAIVGVGLVYLLLWTFFSAGFISVYAAQEERPSFFQQAARFFLRFLVLGVIAGIFYFLLFKFVLNWLTKAVAELTRETIDERIHFTYTVLKYLILWMLVWSVNILFDYSKIFTVLRDHKNALTAPLKAMIVVFGNFFKIYGLYFAIGSLWIVLMFIYWLIAPGAGQASWFTIFAAFLLGQLYIVSRIGMRCLFYAGQTAMCSSLASGEKKYSLIEEY
ncbi:MAG: hypothetical protein ACE5IW_05910 [bacterium]